MNRLTHALRSSGLTLALLVAAAGPAAAASMTFSQGLSFTTGTQSIWGPGKGSASFAASGSASIPATFLTPEIGGGFSLSASSGTVSGSLDGNLSASYQDQLAMPGSTTIDLGFGITGGDVQSHLGAQANITGFIHDVPFFGPWNFCIYCKSYSLDTSISLGGASWGGQRSGPDSFNLAGVGPDLTVLGATAASAQVTMGIDQTAFFTPQNLVGSLVYTHQGTGTTRVVPFSLAGLSSLDVLLDLPGVWDFSFTGLDVANLFRTSVGGSLAIDVSLLGVIDGHWPFANLKILDTPSFGLDFGSQSLASVFSINVVPEPGTMLLLGVGIGGLAILGRTRPRPPGA